MNQTHRPTPLGWRRGSLGELAEITMGQSPPGSSYNTDGKGMPLINGPTEFTDRYPVARQWTTEPTKTCQSGDVLLCVRGSSTGRLNIATDSYCIGRGVAAIRARHLHGSTDFVYAMLLYSTPLLLSLTNGSTFPNIDSKTLASMSVLLPPLPEQRRIAEILGAWDEAIALVERRLAAARERKRGLAQRLLTGQVRFPGFTEPWREVRLGEVAGRNGGRFDPRTEESIGCVELEHIDQGTGRIIGSVPSRQQTSIKNRFSPGQVLFGKLRPYLRKYARPTHSGCCSTEIWVLTGKRGMLNGFLYYVVQTDRFMSAANVTSGTKMPRADWGVVSGMRLPLPPVAEQRRICHVLDECGAQVDTLARKLAALQAQKKGLMQRLLTGEVRVNGSETDGR